jgi:hypothetical protein
MYIRKVFARAFGGLRNHELDLAPGLTIVHGQNESAKSTWHAAITVGLCGRRRGAGRTSADADFEARHRPWDLDESWAVGIELLLDDGREIEIERDLHRQANSVRDVQLGGRAVPDELMRDGSPDAAVWLGLDRTSFASTASVRQADILSVTDEPGSLTEFLGRAAATAGGTESAASAMKRVARFRKDQVGTDRANAVKPLRTAINRVVEAEQRLSEAQRAHSDYLQAAASAEQYRTHLVQLEKRSRSLQFAAEAFDLESAAKRFATLQRLAAQCPDGEPATPTTADLAPLLSARAQLHAVRRLTCVPPLRSLLSLLQCRWCPTARCRLTATPKRLSHSGALLLRKSLLCRPMCRSSRSKAQSLPSCGTLQCGCRRSLNNRRLTSSEKRHTSPTVRSKPKQK